MGLPLPNLVPTGFLPHLDSMDLIVLLARVLISQSKWGTRRGIQTRQIGHARLPTSSIPIHSCYGCSGPYAGRSKAQNRKVAPPQRGMRPGSNFCEQHRTLP